MGLIKLPQRFLSQPQYSVRLNESHPLYKDIVFAYSAGRGPNDGKHGAGSVTGIVDGSVGRRGRRVIPANSTSYVGFPHSADYDTLGEVTIITVLRTGTTVVSQQGLVTKCETGGGTNTPWALLMEGSQQPALNRSNSGFRVWRTSATLSDNTDYVIAVSQGANISVAPRFYINGSYDTSGTASLYGGSGTGAPTGNTTSVKIGNRTDLGTSSSTFIYDTIVLKRVLTDAEIASLSGNIHQVWKAQDSRLWLAAGAQSFSLGCDSGSFAVTGTAATLKFGRLASASSGSFAITGGAATLKLGSKVAANSGTFAVTGTAASLLFGRLLSAGSGSFAITGTDATLTKAAGGQFTLAADSGSFVVTGNASSLVAARLFSASSGSVIVTGTSASLIAKKAFSASSGAIVVTGTDATLILAAHSHYTLAANSGSVDVVGVNASLTRSGGDSFSGGYLYDESRESHAERKKKQRIKFGIEEDSPTLEQFEISNLAEKTTVLVPPSKTHIPARQQKKLAEQEAVNAELKVLLQLELEREEETILRFLMEL